MAQVITIAGEQLFALKAQNNEQLDIDTFIFANVPGQDPNAPINRNEGVPPVGQQVHTQIVQQVGRVNDNVVIYSTVMDSLTGPFEFNWVGLYSSVNQTLIAISHIPTVQKTVTVPGAAGNTLNRNFGIEYSGIADLTGITVAPETWQLDYTARLNGMDELTRQLAADMNGKDWFIENGFKVEPRPTLNTFKVTAGAGYVSGLRVELAADHILTLASYPQFVYVDAWFDGTSGSQWKGQTAFTVTNTEMDDYIDVTGKQHYVFKLAIISAADEIEDLRSVGGVAQLALAAKNGIASTRQQGLPDSYALGVNFTNDTDFAEKSESTDKLVNGNMSVGKDLFGIRRNAVTLSVKANGGNKFAPEITGVSGSQQLADYGSADQAAAFFDIQSNPYQDWEVISTPTYSESGFTAAIDVSKVKVGMIAQTEHVPPYWGIITSFTAAGATVDKWSKAGVPADILPANGSGLKLNPCLKVWTLNANALLLPGGRSDLAAVCEFGLINQKSPDSNGANGVDMVLLGSSTYNGTAAFLARNGGGPATWKIGAMMKDCSLAAFLSENGSRGLVAVNNPVGYVYARNGGATDRVLSVRNGNDYVTSTEVAAIDGSGRVQKLPRRHRVLSEGVTISSEFPLYIYVGNGTIGVNLPNPAAAGFINGDIIKIKNASGTGTIVLNGSLVAAGAAVSTVSLEASRHAYDLVLIDDKWYL